MKNKIIYINRITDGISIYVSSVQCLNQVNMPVSLQIAIIFKQKSFKTSIY